MYGVWTMLSELALMFSSGVTLTAAGPLSRTPNASVVKDIAASAEMGERSAKVWRFHFVILNNFVSRDFIAIPRCPAKSVGLVRYFTTYACTVAELPCADNAHSNSSNMSAWCDFSGAWSDQTPPPHCLCDEGYRVVTINDEEICEG